MLISFYTNLHYISYVINIVNYVLHKRCWMVFDQCWIVLNAGVFKRIQHHPTMLDFSTRHKIMECFWNCLTIWDERLNKLKLHPTSCDTLQDCPTCLIVLNNGFSILLKIDLFSVHSNIVVILFKKRNSTGEMYTVSKFHSINVYLKIR